MDCKFMNIGDALKSFYTVPIYQREYVWESENVEQLLNDIKDNSESSTSTDAHSDSETYFIGSIVVVVENATPPKFVLIDGQQRLTTLFLILCGIRGRLTELEGTTPDWLNNTLRTVTPDEQGNDKLEYRLELNYERNQNILVEAFLGGLPAKTTAEHTPAERNMIQAYSAVTEFIAREVNSANALKKFAANLQEKVGLVRIETTDMQKALIVFETLNDRGVGLDPFDLLKNLLFRAVSNEKTIREITEIWSDIKSYVADSAYIKPLRFLRFFLFSIDDQIGNRPPSERRAFAWFQNDVNLRRFSIDTNPVQFAKRLRVAAKRYNEMLTKNLDHFGKKLPGLSSLNFLAGNAARQHMALLLAAAEKNCPEDKFERLVRSIESVLFYSFSTGMRSQTLEQHFADWTRSLKAMDLTDDSAFQHLLETMRHDTQDAFSAFYDNFSSFGQSSISRSRLLYVLSKFLQKSEESNNDSNYEFLDSLIGKNAQNLDVEHIYPQNPSEAAYAEFGAESVEESEEKVRLLGNLLLMEASLQKSCSNKAYAEKKPKYGESQFWMIKKFTKHELSGTTKLIDSLDAWTTHETWNTTELATRQASLGEIAKQIWNYGD